MGKLTLKEEIDLLKILFAQHISLTQAKMGFLFIDFILERDQESQEELFRLIEQEAESLYKKFAKGLKIETRTDYFKFIKDAIEVEKQELIDHLKMYPELFEKPKPTET